MHMPTCRHAYMNKTKRAKVKKSRLSYFSERIRVSVLLPPPHEPARCCHHCVAHARDTTHSDTQHNVQPVVWNAAVGCNVSIYRSNEEHHIPLAVDGVFQAKAKGKTICPIGPAHLAHRGLMSPGFPLVAIGHSNLCLAIGTQKKKRISWSEPLCCNTALLASHNCSSKSTS